MVQPFPSALRSSSAASRWTDEDAVGAALLRGAVRGAMVGAVARTVLRIVSAAKRGVVLVLGAFGVFVGSVIGVGCAPDRARVRLTIAEAS